LLPPGAAREERLERSCGTDRALRDEIESLLASDRAVRERAPSKMEPAAPQPLLLQRPSPALAHHAADSGRPRARTPRHRFASSVLALAALLGGAGLLVSFLEGRTVGRRFAAEQQTVKNLQLDLQQSRAALEEARQTREAASAQAPGATAAPDVHAVRSHRRAPRRPSAQQSGLAFVRGIRPVEAALPAFVQSPPPCTSIRGRNCSIVPVWP